MLVFSSDCLQYLLGRCCIYMFHQNHVDQGVPLAPEKVAASGGYSRNLTRSARVAPVPIP